MDYKNAGVDIEAGYKSVELMKEHVKEDYARRSIRRTWRIFRCIFSSKVLKKWKSRFFLSGTDGCGTKVKLAIYHGQA